MIQAIKNLLFKKEEPLPLYPFERAIIKVSEIARMKGVYDDENKVIEHWKGNKKKVYPYSEAQVNALIENEVPLFEEDYEDEEFDWDEPTEMGYVKIIK